MESSILSVYALFIYIEYNTGYAACANDNDASYANFANDMPMTGLSGVRVGRSRMRTWNLTNTA